MHKLAERGQTVEGEGCGSRRAWLPPRQSAAIFAQAWLGIACIDRLPQHFADFGLPILQRKNGLFKKAYELGVLCSVDVAVIIFGAWSAVTVDGVGG